MICCLLTLSIIIIALILLLAAIPIILTVFGAAVLVRAVAGGTESLSVDQALALEYPYCRFFKNRDQLLDSYENVKAYKYKLITAPYKILNMPTLPPAMLNFSGSAPPQPTLIELAPEDYEAMNWMSDWFNEKCRLACKRYDEESSPLDYWAANKQEVVAALERRRIPLTYQALHDELYRRTIGCNNFRPGLLRGAIEYFGAHSVLDPSAGWGDRLIGALAAGVRYVGVDPNPCVHKGYTEIIETLAANDGPAPTLIMAPFQDCDLPAGETYDMVFTSPPYFDLEIYSDDKTQSTNEFQQLDVWFEGFLIKSLSKAWSVLNGAGHMIIVINNIRDGPDFVMKMIERVNQFPGARSLGVLSYAEKRATYKSPQPMWIWRKDIIGDHEYMFYDCDKQLVMTPENFSAIHPRVYEFNDITPCEARSAWKDLHENDWVLTGRPAENSLHSLFGGLPDARYHGRLSDGRPVWKKETIIVNPPLVLDTHEGFIVVRDDLLPGGTKQRAMSIIEDYPEKELVYAGPWNGYAQVALSMGGKLYGKRITLFMTRDDYATNIRAKTYGANFIVRPGAALADLQRGAKEYAESSPDRRLMEFGFDSPEFRRKLAAQITAAASNAEWGNYEGTVWLVAGSGTLLNVLYQIFTNARFGVVQVGKTIWPDQMDEARTVLYKAPEGFYDEALQSPPYPSASRYDAKLWQFARAYGEPGDIIWNVAG